MRKKLGELRWRSSEGRRRSSRKKMLRRRRSKLQKTRRKRRKKISEVKEALRLLNVAQERLPQAQKELASVQKAGRDMWLFVDDNLSSLRLGIIRNFAKQ